SRNRDSTTQRIENTKQTLTLGSISPTRSGDRVATSRSQQTLTLEAFARFEWRPNRYRSKQDDELGSKTSSIWGFGVIIGGKSGSKSVNLAAKRQK
ncbi:unnamed protein product, partial [Musa banksii]